MDGMFQSAFGRVVTALQSPSFLPSSHGDPRQDTGPIQTVHDDVNAPVLNDNRLPSITNQPKRELPGPSLIPLKRKPSPTTTNRPSKSIKVENLPTLAQFATMGGVIDLVSDEEEPSSAVSSESTIFGRQNNTTNGTGKTSTTNDFKEKPKVAMVGRHPRAPAEVPSNLPRMGQEDLYSMFLKADRNSSEESDSRDESLGMLFGSNQPRSSHSAIQEDFRTTCSENSTRTASSKSLLKSSNSESSLFLSQNDSATTPKLLDNLARVKKYRERSELGAVDASRALREKALAKDNEPKSLRKVVTAPQAISQDQEILIQLKGARVPEGTGSSINRSMESSGLQDGDVYPPENSPPNRNPGTSVLRGASAPRLKNGDTLRAPSVKRPNSPGPSIPTVSNADEKSNKLVTGPNMVDLSDEACEKDSNIMCNRIPKPIPHRATSEARNRAPSNGLGDTERSEQLMEALLKNQKARKTHAKLISHSIPIPHDSSTSRFKRSSQNTSLHTNRLDSDPSLRMNKSTGKRVAEAQKTRLPSDLDLLPPAGLSKWSSSLSAAKGSLQDPENNDLKTAREKKLSWEAIGNAALAGYALVETHGLADNTVKELRELRWFEEMAASGANLSITERRRIQDIKSNVKRRKEREDSKKVDFAVASGGPPAPDNRSKEEEKQIKNVLNTLRDILQRAEQAANDLQNESLKKLDAERMARLDVRRAQNKHQRRKKQEQEEALIRAKLRLYDDAEDHPQLKNGVESESEEEGSERGASPDSTSDIISDEDEGFIRVPRAAIEKHETPTITSRPPGSRRNVGEKTVSARTLEILRQERLQIGMTTNDGFVLLESPNQTENLALRPTTGVKTVNLDLLQELIGIEAEAEQDSEDGEDEDLWMYQIWITQHGSTSDDHEITKEHLGSYYTLGEANKRASRAAMNIAHTPEELSFIDSRTIIQDGIFAHSITYASGRNLSINIERVPIQVREAGLHSANYRIRSKVWIVHQRVFHSPEPTADNLFDEEAPEEPCQTTQGVFTVQRRANEAASACLVKTLTAGSSKADDEAYKATIDMSARQYLREISESGTLFMSTEDIPGTNGGKVKVWVEESLVQGPRN